MKRYFVAQTTTSKYVGIYTTQDIAALLNANRIQEDYVVTECACTGPSYAQLMKSGDATWVTISKLLAATYKDTPLITVILNDVENNTFLLTERYHSDDGPWQVALGAAEDYFDRHFKEFAKRPPKPFLLYFQSDKCPPSVMTFKLKVESHTVYKGIIGSKQDPSEETFPYKFVDYSSPHNVEPPDEFPSVALELKPPKYDPTAPLP
jgi:hypothetical protein